MGNDLVMTVNIPASAYLGCLAGNLRLIPAWNKAIAPDVPDFAELKQNEHGQLYFSWVRFDWKIQF